MCLRFLDRFAGRSPWNYGECVGLRARRCSAQCCCRPQAQQAQPAGLRYPPDSRRRFDDSRNPPRRRRRPRRRDAELRPAGGGADTNAAVRAASRLHHRRPRHPARATGRGLATLYRQEGVAGRPRRHRRRPSATSTAPPAFISAAPSCRRRTSRTAAVRIQMIEGGITEVVLKGEGAEQFGIRAMLGAGRRRAAGAPRNAGAATDADQQRGRACASTTPSSRRSERERQLPPVVISVKTWHVYAFAGLDNLGSSAVGPWQSYATAAYNSHDPPGDTLAVNLATTPGDPRQLRFGAAVLRYADRHRRVAGRRLRPLQRSVARRLAAAVCDNTKTEAFECAPASCR